jgi:2-oxoglutarate dehydrogenase E2 component (dihydrolipoamide succinyltransferase)
MPQLGETVADGTVTKWFKAVGDAVNKGEPLFEVSTDKVDTEIPSPASGVLSAIIVQEGETVDVGTILAVIDNDEPDGNVQRPSSSVAASPEAIATPSERVENDQRLSPAVRRLLEDHKLEASDIAATGPGGRLTRDDVEAFIAQSTTAASTTNSPIVRHLIDAHDLDVSSVEGSGPSGRLSRHDVEAAINARGGEAEDEVVPFTKLRRLTAERMVHSKATSAHTLMVKEVDYEHVENYRRLHGGDFKEREGFTLTYLPFISLAVLDALIAFPQLNASVGNDELIVHRDLNLGIAVDLDGDGLVVPVIRHANQLDLFEIARRIRQVAQDARAKKLTVDDVTGATFTITNPGPYGTLMTGAIINQPQVAILATDGVTRKPVVVMDPYGDESITIHSVGLLALTFDHRAIDGATAARFLAHVDAQLNNRDWIHE